MKAKLKKIPDQVIVITGASSGIGLSTARMAAEQGARLVLAARNGEALDELVDELHGGGKQVVSVTADVANEEDVRRIAAAAIEAFGRIDTWVNNAGVSIYGKLTDVPTEDSRRLFETNFWGVVNGSRVAIPYLKLGGGALINIGSVLSDRAIPLQGMYSATKHAVKGFTDALRMELEEEKAPISVTLIKPAAIDTPYTEHARNYLETEPTNAPPVYAPRIVAEAILHAAEHPVRDLFVGGSAKMIATAAKIAPRVTDRLMEKTMFEGQKTDEPVHRRDDDALYFAGDGGREYGMTAVRTKETSLYTKIAMHPLRAALVAAAGAAIAALVGGAVAKRRLLASL